MSVWSRLGVTRAIATIRGAEDADQPEVAQAAEKLRQIGTDSLPKLFEALIGGGPPVSVLQDVLASMLSDATLPAFAQALFHKKVEIVDRVTEVLKRRGLYDPNGLLYLFLDPDSPKAALADIVASHSRRVDNREILRLLDDVKPETRPFLLSILRHSAGPKLMPELARRLEGAETAVRQELVRVLARADDEEVQQALIRCLTNDPSKGVRLGALDALAEMPRPIPTEALLDVLRDSDMVLQGKVLDRLAASDDPKLTARVVALLADGDERVRRAAVEILNRRPDPAAIGPLVATLQDEDWWFRERAGDALVALGGERVLHALMARFVEDDAELQQALIQVIVRLEGTTDLLRGFLEHRSDALRRGAVRALGALGDTDVVPALLPMLSGDDGDRPAVVAALQALRDVRAIRPLLAQLELAREEGEQRAILEALEKVTDRDNAAFVIEQVRRIAHRVESEVLRLSAERAVQSLGVRFDQTTSPEPVSGPSPIATVQSPLLVRKPKPKPSEPGPPATPTAPVSKTAGTDSDSPRDTMVDLSIAADSLNPLALRAGDRLADRYRVIRQVGRGGFGIVVLVEDEIVHEEMILKFLAPHVAQDEVVVHRFMHEIRYARRITHENVIRIHDLISFGQTFAISMEYFSSHSLVAELHRYKQIPVDRGRDILTPVCHGLGAAHREGVIHRDLKPGNILIDDAMQVKIVDFGLAAAASQGASRLTRSGLVIGTPIYMAPEQIEGGAIDARTDVYSLGVLMYEMFTGKVPYEGENAMATLFKHLHGKARAPRAANAKIPEALEAIILKAMAREPGHRFQDTLTLATALEGLEL